MKVLALDVSGSCTGWALGVNGKLEAKGKFISKATSPKGEKLMSFSLWLESLLTSKTPDVVLIEKPYKGRNSNVLANISKFIGVVELVAFKTLNLVLKEEWFIDPKTIKKSLQVKKGMDYDDNKRIMVARINSLYGLKLKFGKNKSKKYNDDDVADAIALLHTFLKSE